MIVNLKSGVLQGLAADGAPDVDNCVERPALLVYAGNFLSANGPVTVTEAQIRRLVENHNALLERVKRLVGGGAVPLKNCPPLQLDHSTSARDTVGRLVGQLTLGQHVNDDGETVAAIFGTLRFLGRDNCERVQDGRWTHLSVGADFELGKFSELTITPFPAAGAASLLKAERLSDENTETQTPAKQETVPMVVDKAKLKKYLTGSKKMSESDADMELSKADEEALKKLSADCDEDEKRLSAEADAEKARLSAETADADAKKKETEDREARLTGQRANLTKLATDFRAQVTAAQLAAKSGRILTRLSKLRAEAKISPAEIKKLDIAKLAATDDAAVALVLKSYEDREPVVFVGQLGSSKAVDLANLAGTKEARIAQLEAETRANMSMLSGAAPNAKDLGPGATVVASGATHAAAAPTADDVAIAEKEHVELCALLDKGDAAGAKVRLKAWLHRTSALSSVAEYTESATAETEAQLDALVKGIERLQTGFNDLTKLAGEIAGITI